MSEKLIELMAEEMVNNYNKEFPNTRRGTFKEQQSHVRDGLLKQAGSMLSVIRQNVHLVAEKCTRCSGVVDTFIANGDDDNPEYTKVCPNCKGHGIIAKQEGVN